MNHRPADLLLSFDLATRDWVVVYLDVDAPLERDPWRVEAVVGFAVVAVWDDSDDRRHRQIQPIVAGEHLFPCTEWMGIYLREDLVLPHVRDRLLDVCDKARAAYLRRKLEIGARA